MIATVIVVRGSHHSRSPEARARWTAELYTKVSGVRLACKGFSNPVRNVRVRGRSSIKRFFEKHRIGLSRRTGARLSYYSEESSRLATIPRKQYLSERSEWRARGDGAPALRPIGRAMRECSGGLATAQGRSQASLSYTLHPRADRSPAMAMPQRHLRECGALLSSTASPVFSLPNTRCSPGETADGAETLVVTNPRSHPTPSSHGVPLAA